MQDTRYRVTLTTNSAASKASATMWTIAKKLCRGAHHNGGKVVFCYVSQHDKAAFEDAMNDAHQVVSFEEVA